MQSDATRTLAFWLVASDALSRARSLALITHRLSAQGDGVDGSNRNVPALVQALAYAQPELASKYLSSLRPLVVPSSIEYVVAYSLAFARTP